jgi:hypothetical protein
MKKTIMLTLGLLSISGLFAEAAISAYGRGGRGQWSRRQQQGNVSHNIYNGSQEEAPIGDRTEGSIFDDEHNGIGLAKPTEEENIKRDEEKPEKKDEKKNVSHNVYNGSEEGSLQAAVPQVSISGQANPVPQVSISGQANPVAQGSISHQANPVAAAAQEKNI